jgi:RNA polymerase sigma-70 factor (ECF subfamily)
MDICFGARQLRLTRNLDLGDEQVLVERCRREDPEAFARIVDAYQGRVFGFVRKMLRDPDEASDVAQEVFIRAFQSFKRFDGRSSLRTWLFKIAHNLCIDRSRRRERAPVETSLEPALDDDAQWDLPDSRWDPEAMAMDGEFMTVVDKGIAEMSEKLRSVLLMHDREDMAYEEIASALELPLGTVKSRLFLARAHLHDVIRDYLNQEAKAYE